MLYYGTDDNEVQLLEAALKKCFNLELMGQAHWYLGTWISQLANYDIVIDQSRYCLSIIKRYLETAGCKCDWKAHTTPLPLDFVPSADDWSKDEEAVIVLSRETSTLHHALEL